MKLEELESWLWGAANILRGPVDQSDFKSYIFPMLFFKRISDVYDEELQESMEIYGEDFDEEHRFIIPKGCHWNEVRSVTKNVGIKILSSIREIEKANPESLYGIFGDTQWSNKDKLTDEILIELIEHFSQYNLGNKNVKSNTMGQAYEYLIKKFADVANKKAGEFYTPREIVKLMTMLLDPEENESIYDPACGTGGMLLEAVDHLNDTSRDARTLKLYGQEKNLTTSSIARMNLFLHGLEDFKIVRNDTLKNPAYFEEDKLMTFDCVIANPPFSLKSWGYEEWKDDPYGRNIAGIPPKTNGDYAWVQHMIKSMEMYTGRMAVVLSQGVLFRAGAEGKIRRELLQQDLLDTVIGLAPNLFYGTNISACILFFRKDKPVDRKGKVQFIDASQLFKKERNQNTLLLEHVNEIFKLYNEYNTTKGKTSIATLDDIKSNNFNLNIPLYVKPIIEDDGISLEQAYNEMVQALKETNESENVLNSFLKEMDV
ncbi:type I restriction-modification system subunit M [Evansella cellulosilytica]|uniref:site-specific DNA-methyltransferase (adenine-specific) n=1 Tax=Evansella cellulosilytica (strain ATCC 21833 / DSM 2522 / FERM P-1141 / JCM 9156 / N-4) TaxID=649639 RepID=E6TZV2_EVAC2|nr:class I SAM-dependent DNA methyltransferase [Evansella cellulosilytica]ADU32518.1 Site-specific DNA-methyltransferase (adenine-specific) [Evansella cellulosilytica DSM 2522]